MASEIPQARSFGGLEVVNGETTASPSGLLRARGYSLPVPPFSLCVADVGHIIMHRPTPFYLDELSMQSTQYVWPFIYKS